MPQFLAAAIEAVGWALTGSAGTFAAGSFLVFNAGTIAAGALLVGGLAYMGSQRRKAKRQARDAYNAAQVDRLANVDTTVGPRELVLGRVRKGGQVLFKGSVGQYKEKFAMIVAMAGHECDGIETYFLNDAAVTVDGSGYVTSAPYALSRNVPAWQAGNVSPVDAIPGSVYYDVETNTTNYQVAEAVPKARLRFFSGADSQAAAADVVADFPSLWTSNHRLRGVAYILAEFWFDESAFPSGLPRVSAIIRGAKCFDPRSGLTVWTENPAIQARHVLTHPFFGGRTSITADEGTRIATAANACDTSYNYGDGAVALYRSSIVFPFGTSAADALDDLAQAMGGMWAYAAGELYLRAGVYTAPVMSLGEADLLLRVEGEGGGAQEQDVVINTHRSRAEKLNTITPRIYDAAQGYKLAALTPLVVSSYLSRDGKRLAGEVEFAAVSYAKQAHHIAGIMLRDGRDPLTIEISFKLKAWPLELFDTISLTLPQYGWSAKPFSILQRTYSPDTGVRLTLKETAAAIFQPDASFPSQGFADNTALPRPWDIPAPSITSIASGDAELLQLADGTIQARVRVQWAALLDASLLEGGFVDVDWADPSLGAPLQWRRESFRADQTSGFLVNAPEGRVILIRARTRSKIAVSNWTVQQVHQVLGKLAPPPNMQDFGIAGRTLSWTVPANVLDLAGARLRFHYGSNVVWANAAPLHEGLITESPWEPPTSPGGPVTILGKLVDTSGNESEQAAVIFTDLGDPLVANVVQTIDFDALAYPGSVSGGTLSGGDLLANSTTAGWPADPALPDDPADSASPAWQALSYVPLVYTSDPFEVSAALAGSLATLTSDTAGDGLVIEYRRWGAAPGWPLGSSGPDDPADSADPAWPENAPWQPWPGQLQVENGTYQLRVSIGGGAVQGRINALALVVDAPDYTYTVSNLAIAIGGTVIPLPVAPAKLFTSVQAITFSLQAGTSGAVGLTIDKANPLAPVVRALNGAGTAVAGASADFTLKGY